MIGQSEIAFSQRESCGLERRGREDVFASLGQPLGVSDEGPHSFVTDEVPDKYSKCVLLDGKPLDVGEMQLSLNFLPSYVQERLRRPSPRGKRCV